MLKNTLNQTLRGLGKQDIPLQVTSSGELMCASTRKPGYLGLITAKMIIHQFFESIFRN